MKANVLIKEIATYHPENKVSNEFFLEHFSKQGKNKEDLRHFIEDIMGRKTRNLSKDPNETPLTMAIEAVKRVLEKASLKGSDVDMIVFSSGTPEYVQPSNAIKIHQAIDGKSSAIVYDMNACCVGMVISLDQVSRFLISNPYVKYALIVGAEQMNRYANPTDEVTYTNFADAACAVLIERVENTDSGIIDSCYYTDSSLHDNIVFPGCGYSKLLSDDVSEEEKKVRWVPFDGTCPVEHATKSINNILVRNGVDKSEISQYLLSQFAKINIDLIRENLNEEESKFIYVGDEYGYTGTSSPFIALERSIEENRVKRGDNVVFWSVGSGWTICTVLFKF